MLTLKEEHKTLRTIFESKRNKNGEWRKLHNDKLQDLYHSPNTVRIIKSRRLRWSSHIISRKDDRNPLKIFIRKLMDNIKMDLVEVGIKNMN